MKGAVGIVLIGTACGAWAGAAPWDATAYDSSTAGWFSWARDMAAAARAAHPLNPAQVTPILARQAQDVAKAGTAPSHEPDSTAGAAVPLNIVPLNRL